MNEKPALFLDRDGVINVEKNYLHKIEEFEFLEHVFDACRRFKHLGFKIIVVTNQAGIARGYYTENQFNILNEWMLKEFQLNGIDIDGVYYCPHHPQGEVESLSIICDCRKPKPGMIIKAQQDLGLDLSASVMVGDKVSDVQAGIAAGVGKNILVKTGHTFEQNVAAVACQVIENLSFLQPN